MSQKIWVWKKVPGIIGRCNDIIYSRPMLPVNQDILLYFGGDVQDIQENMEQHADSKKYVEWSLQNTALILSKNFPKYHILVVRPSRIYVTRSAMFSCFDNFVSSNEYGVPSFAPTHNALKHLQELVKSAVDHIQTCDENQDPTHFNVDEMKLVLVGFSKGCVVLNQLLHEFHHYANESKSDSGINNFIKHIESMWWLDGGHAGVKDTWITEKSILESFANLRINVNVHVTPYQVQDSYRPWICKEENQFCNLLQNMGVPIKRTLHFANKSRKIRKILIKYSYRIYASLEIYNKTLIEKTVVCFGVSNTYCRRKFVLTGALYVCYTDVILHSPSLRTNRELYYVDTRHQRVKYMQFLSVVSHYIEISRQNSKTFIIQAKQNISAFYFSDCLTIIV